MLADELARAQARATVQAEQRNARYQARSNSDSASTNITSDPPLNFSRPNTNMVDHQFGKVIDSIPTFSGEPRENVNDWLKIVSLKFDIFGYYSHQKRRFIPQYLAGNALKWHLAHRAQLSSWDEYTEAITAAFPRLITTSRDMNLKKLKDRKQGDTESFIDYYTSVIDLCRKHDADMDDLHIIDWLKAGMQIHLYEKLQGEEFQTPQGLLSRAQRVELDNAVLDARKREDSVHPLVVPTSPTIHHESSKRWDSTSYPQSSSTPIYQSSYPPPLLSIPTSASYAPSFSAPPGPRALVPSQSPSSNYSGPQTTDSTNRSRRSVTCYACGQYGHISPHCPYRPKD